MEKEVWSLILDVVKQRRSRVTAEKDLLRWILEGATDSDFGKDVKDRFIVNDCKNIYSDLNLDFDVAGFECPEWQAKVRDEVVEVYSRQPLGANMIRKMKVVRNPAA